MKRSKQTARYLRLKRRREENRANAVHLEAPEPLYIDMDKLFGKKPKKQEPHKSFALWPEGVCSTVRGDNTSSDTHHSKDAALAVCRALERDGFGGDGVHFPVRTWVEKVEVSA